MASGRRKRKKEPLEETHTQEVDGSSNVCPPSTVLPPCLASIEGTFSRLNTLLTFLGVQRQMLGITLAQAQAAFMSQTGSELTEDMLGQMVAIAPSLMNVFWLPEGLRKLEDDTFAIQGSSKESRTPKNYVLMIEFKDSRPPSVKKGTPSLSSSLKTQSIAVLSKKIQSRNAAFRKCLLDFAATHGLQHQELEKTLSQMGAESLPRKPQGDQATASQGLYSSSRGKPIQCERPRSLERMLKDLAKETFYNGQMGETLRSIPEKDALYGELDENYPVKLKDEISQIYPRLYSHQASALSHLGNGHHVILSTPTSSGKSLVYQLASLRNIHEDGSSRALYIFPTKALAQDQKKSFQNIIGKLSSVSNTRVDTLDGDTSFKNGVRDVIRNGSNVLFTNPDMLHVTILPRHANWKPFLQNLKIVVVDELHYYSGTFGVHCSMIMRRLQRLCHHYGNYDVKFMACSATIANPKEHAEAFFGIQVVRVVDTNTSPSGKKLSIIWNPPLRNSERYHEGRVSSIEEAIRLITFLMRKGVRTICFTKSRRVCELLLKETQSAFKEEDPDYVDRIHSYRSGYSAEDRRHIEGQLFRGELLCIIATNALELGVDIGSLDCVIHLGFPHNVASFRQQSGRAGRRERDSLSIMVAEGDNSMDQYYAKNPDDIYGAALENVVLDLENEVILENHLHCAAAELALHPDRDFSYFGDDALVEDICDKSLRFDSTYNVYHADKKYDNRPAKHISIRAIADEGIRVIDVSTNSELETVELSRVPFTLYPDAIFIVQGHSFLVIDVHEKAQVARVRPVSVDYATACTDFADVTPAKTTDTFVMARMGQPIIASLGAVTVKTVVLGYQKYNPRTKQVFETIKHEEQSTFTKEGLGFWIDLPIDIVLELQEAEIDVEASIHGALHTILSLIPVFILSSCALSIKVNCPPLNSTRTRPPRLIFYGSKKSKGLFDKVVRFLKELLVRSRQVVVNCDCESGCPGCIQTPSCRISNLRLDKKGTTMLLNSMLRIM